MLFKELCYSSFAAWGRLQLHSHPLTHSAYTHKNQNTHNTQTARAGGKVTNAADCPPNYPAGAPADQCGHVALVEIDAMMAYKYASAYAANRGAARYGQLAVTALDAWASRNTEFGLNYRNGPLEAAWAGAAAARAGELLKYTRFRGYTAAVHARVCTWLGGVLLPQMDHYVNVISAKALERGDQNVYGARVCVLVFVCWARRGGGVRLTWALLPQIWTTMTIGVCKAYSALPTQLLLLKPPM